MLLSLQKHQRVALRKAGTFAIPVCWLAGTTQSLRLEDSMSIGTIILIILVIALLGGFSGVGGGPFYGTGYYGGGGLRVVILILLILALPGPPLSGCGRGG